MPPRNLPLLDDPEAKRILRDLCKEHDLSLDLLVKMLTIQRAHLGRGRQMGITQDFSAEIADFLESRGSR